MRSVLPTLNDLTLPPPASSLDEELSREIDHRTEWLARRFGVIDDRPGTMSIQSFRGGKFGTLSVLAYPNADLDGLVLANDFNTYLFYVDDQAEEDENYGKRPELLEAYFQGHVHALRTGQAPWARDPGTRLLLSLRDRLLRRASPRWLQRFAAEVEAYLLRGTLVGARHWTAGSVPTPTAYANQRAWDSAVFCSQDLAEVAGGAELSAEVRGDAAFQRSRELVTRVVAFTNDLVSYPKEVQRHHSPNNLVHVEMVHAGVPLTEALWRVVDTVNDDVAAFERVAADVASRATTSADALATYQSCQRAWMAANLTWSIRSGRYLDPDSPFVELRTAQPDQASA